MDHICVDGKTFQLKKLDDIAAAGPAALAEPESFEWRFEYLRLIRFLLGPLTETSIHWNDIYNGFEIQLKGKYSGNFCIRLTPVLLEELAKFKKESNLIKKL